MKHNKKLIGTSLLTATTASLCCISPILAMLAGTSGIASTFSWIDPFRPYLIGLTVLVLVFAWYQQLRPRTQKELDCACDEDEKPSFWQSKKFLGIITLFAAIMLTFPYYSSVLYPENKTNDTLTMSNNIREITVDVKGMTCRGCEAHVESEVNKLDGILKVNADFEKANTIIKFDDAKVDARKIEEAILKTGYKIVK
ncbi:MAG: mercuric transport protein MerTP [Maribacter sp.]